MRQVCIWTEPDYEDCEWRQHGPGAWGVRLDGEGGPHRGQLEHQKKDKQWWSCKSQNLSGNWHAEHIKYFFVDLTRQLARFDYLTRQGGFYAKSFVQLLTCVKIKCYNGDCRFYTRSWNLSTTHQVSSGCVIHVAWAWPDSRGLTTEHSSLCLSFSDSYCLIYHVENEPAQNWGGKRI